MKYYKIPVVQFGQEREVPAKKTLLSLTLKHPFLVADRNFAAGSQPKRFVGGESLSADKSAVGTTAIDKLVPLFSLRILGAADLSVVAGTLRILQY